MWYVIDARDAQDSLAARREARPAHLERLTALRDAGRLLLVRRDHEPYGGAEHRQDPDAAAS